MCRLYHIGIHIYGVDSGVVAVVSFFIISGYAMTALIDRHHSNPKRFLSFALDRALRLCPQYWFYLALSLILIFEFRPQSIYLSDIRLDMLLLNAAIIPLNFFAWSYHCFILPQAWSLGLESQFYAVIPFIIAYRLRLTAFMLSAIFFVLPYFDILNTNIWGYLMLPGTLFVFMFGSFLYRKDHKIISVGAYIVICIAFTRTEFMSPPNQWDIDVLLGIIIGVPMVAILSKVRLGIVDEFAGNLSYGVFLNHFFLIWLFQVMGYSRQQPFYIAYLMAASISLSTLSYFLIERPTLKLRRAMRISTSYSRASVSVG